VAYSKTALFAALNLMPQITDRGNIDKAFSINSLEEHSGPQ
jgi:hypothetical protein